MKKTLIKNLIIGNLYYDLNHNITLMYINKINDGYIFYPMQPSKISIFEFHPHQSQDYIFKVIEL